MNLAEMRAKAATGKIWTDEEVDSIERTEHTQYSFTVKGLNGRPDIVGFGMDYTEFLVRRVFSEQLIKDLDFSGCTILPFFIAQKGFIRCNFDNCIVNPYNFLQCKLLGCSFKNVKFEYGSTGFSSLAFCDFEGSNIDFSMMPTVELEGPNKFPIRMLVNRKVERLSLIHDPLEIEEEYQTMLKWRDIVDEGIPSEEETK